MPRLEEVKFKPGRETSLRLWLHEQLTNTISDRRPIERRWDRQIEDWRARMPDSEAEFPFVGASNTVFPLTAIHVDPVYSDFMATFHASRNFWNASPRRPGRVEHANSLREALAAINEDFLHMREVNKLGFLYTTVLGTCIYKDHWLDQTSVRMGYNEDGSIGPRLSRKNQPKIEVIPPQHFYIPADAWNIDPDATVGPAAWVAQKFFTTPARIKAEADSDGLFIPPYRRDEAERVMRWVETKYEPTDEKIQAEDDFEPFRDDKIELFEIWARFDTNADGIDEDIVIVMHLPTMTILRAMHVPFMHGKRPFEAVQYLPTFSFYGMGIAEISEWSQYTITKLLNAQVDNALLSNTRMFGVPKGSGVLPGEPIYPGKMWMLDAGEQVQEIKMSDIYSSLPLSIQQQLQYSQLRSGVNELRQGDVSDLPSRTPAATTLSALREGSKRFDMIVNNMRPSFGRMGLRCLQNISQFMRDDPERWITYFNQTLGEKDAAQVLEVLSQPVDTLGEEFGISVSATSALANQEVEKQSFIAVLQLVSQLYPQLVQTAQLMETLPPESITAQTAQAAYTGGVELLQRLLERFDIQNPEAYVPQPQPQQQPAGIAPPQVGIPPVIPFPGGGGAF